MDTYQTGKPIYSIPTQRLSELVDQIKISCLEWIHIEAPKKPKSEDLIEWDGSSQVVRAYFARFKIFPCEHERFQHFYVKSNPSVSVSYVWAETSLVDIAGDSFFCESPSFTLLHSAVEFRKKKYRGKTAFIDVLTTLQTQNFENNFQNIKSNFGNVLVVIFLSKSFFQRCWCCAEFAFALSCCSFVTVGSIINVCGDDLFKNMVASNTADLQLIKSKILEEYSDENSFNKAIHSGMARLIASLSIATPCKLHEAERVQRKGWRELLESKGPQGRPRNALRDAAVLRGHLENDFSSPAERLLRVYLSTSPYDTAVESQAFLEDGLPFLQVCARKRGMDLLLVDMRKNVGMNTDSLIHYHKDRELQRCLSTSAGLACLMLCGETYRHGPLPSLIPKEEFESLAARMDCEEGQSINSCYRIDSNRLVDNKNGSDYVLQTAAFKDFKKAQAALRRNATVDWIHDALGHDVHFRSKHHLKKYFLSSVESVLLQTAEFCGWDKVGIGAKMHAFYRTSVLGEHIPAAVQEMFFDSMCGACEKQHVSCCVENPREALATLLPPGNLHILGPVILAGPAGLSQDTHREYLLAAVDELCRVVLESLDATEALLAQVDHPVAEEATHHLLFAQQYACQFFETDASIHALMRIKQYIKEPSLGRALIIHGSLGAGKTHIMAKAAADTCREMVGEPVAIVVRFAGATICSRDKEKLLKGLSAQLQLLESGCKSAADCVQMTKETFHDLCTRVSMSLADWKDGRLILFMDGFDELEALEPSTSHPSTLLPWDGYAEQVHVVISAADQENGAQKLHESINACANQDFFVQVQPLQKMRDLLLHILKLQQRSATETQLSEAINAMEQAEVHERTPLTVSVLACTLSRLQSFDGIERVQNSFGGLMADFFSRLESSYGQAIVKHILSYLSLSTSGASESELQALLSSSEHAVSEASDWWLISQHQIPIAIVLEVLNDMDPFLFKQLQKQGAALLCWKHISLQEAACAHYVSDLHFRAEIHRIMSDFFCGSSVDQTKDDCMSGQCISSSISFDKRMRRPQPLNLTGESPLQFGVVYNERRCVEAPHHLLCELKIRHSTLSGEQHLALVNRTMQEICCVVGICSRVLIGDISKVLSNFEELKKILDCRNSDYELVEEFNLWIQQNYHHFDSAGHIVVSVLGQPAGSMVQENFQRLDPATRLAMGVPYAVFRISPDTNKAKVAVKYVTWNPMRIQIASAHADGSVRIFAADTGDMLLHLKCNAQVACLVWNRQGDRIAFVSKELTCAACIWNSVTGEKLSELNSAFQSIDWSTNGDQVVSCSSENAVAVWDIATGLKVSLMKGHSSHVTAVAWSPRGDKIATGSQDLSIVLWNMPSAIKVCSLHGHINPVTCLSWKFDGAQIVSGSWDNNMIIWDAQTGISVFKLKGHSKKVTSVAWSPVDEMIVSGSNDKSALVWHPRLGTKITELRAHAGGVNSVAWNGSGTQIVTGSDDGNVVIWSMQGSKIWSGQEGSITENQCASGPDVIACYQMKEVTNAIEKGSFDQRFSNEFSIFKSEGSNTSERSDVADCGNDDIQTSINGSQATPSTEIQENVATLHLNIVHNSRESSSNSEDLPQTSRQNSGALFSTPRSPILYGGSTIAPGDDVEGRCRPMAANKKLTVEMMVGVARSNGRHTAARVREVRVALQTQDLPLFFEDESVLLGLLHDSVKPGDNVTGRCRRYLDPSELRTGLLVGVRHPNGQLTAACVLEIQMLTQPPLALVDFGLNYIIWQRADFLLGLLQNSLSLGDNVSGNCEGLLDPRHVQEGLAVGVLRSDDRITAGIIGTTSEFPGFVMVKLEMLGPSVQASKHVNESQLFALSPYACIPGALSPSLLASATYGGTSALGVDVTGKCWGRLEPRALQAGLVVGVHSSNGKLISARVLGSQLVVVDVEMGLHKVVPSSEVLELEDSVLASQGTEISPSAGSAGSLGWRPSRETVVTGPVGAHDVAADGAARRSGQVEAEDTAEVV